MKVLGQSLKSLENQSQREFKKIDRRFKNIDRRFKNIDKRFKNIDKRFENIDKRFVNIDKRFDKVDEEFKAVRNEMTERSIFLLSRIDAVDQKIDGLEQGIAKFRNEMLTIMDFVRKDYDNFRQEKLMLAAGQDRLQGEVSQHGEALRVLDLRVTQLESSRA
jgi:septation ring formation regulator EzrA